MIRFLFKTLLVIAIILVALSFFAPSNYNGGQSPSMMNTIYAVKDVLGDFGGFCDRNSQSCDTIKSYIATFIARVKEGAMLAYKYIFETVTNSFQHTQNMQKLPPPALAYMQYIQEAYAMKAI